MTSIRETAEKFNTDDFKGRILFSETMANHTTFRIGGPAPLFIEPFDVPSLRFALSVLKTDAVPYFVLGGGSNIVVSDKGFEGAVVSMSALCDIEVDGEYVASGAGASVSSVVSFCTEHALSGLEAFAGLPGSAGGAVYMNARCFDVSVSDILSEVRYIDGSTLEEKTYRFNAADWDYKISPFQNTPRIVTCAVFKTRRLSEDKKKEIAERCKTCVAERSAGIIKIAKSEVFRRFSRRPRFRHGSFGRNTRHERRRRAFGDGCASGARRAVRKEVYECAFDRHALFRRNAPRYGRSC